MAACKTCATEITKEGLELTGGNCRGCGYRVCFICGSTEANPCVKLSDDGQGAIVCTWPEVLAPRVGFRVTFAFFNECTFCYFARAELLYARVTAEQEAAGVFDEGDDFEDDDEE